MTLLPLRYENGILYVLDQRKLPREEEYLVCDTVEKIFEAIRELAVRGAPLVAIAAGYGIAVGLRQYRSIKELDYIFTLLRSARPTAYNIFFLLDRIEKVLKQISCLDECIVLSENLAKEFHEEDRLLCESISLNGLEVLPDNATVITYCNTGRLATGGIGTALGVIYKGFDLGKINHVYVCETRPLLQGARLTAYELSKSGIPFTLISDNMVASLFSKKIVDLAIVGADRIAKNGDTANKIGTFNLAVVSNYFGVPFYVAVPYTTIDFSLSSGEEIEIEYRKKEEIIYFGGVQVAPYEASVWNPAFDITPEKLIKGIITDRGVIKPEEISSFFYSLPR